MLVKADDRTVQASRHAGISKEVIIARGVLPHFTQVAISILNTGQTTEPHHHPTMFEVFFVLEGEGIHVIAGDEFRVSVGDFLIVPPGAMHYQEVTRGPHKLLYWGVEQQGIHDPTCGQRGV